MITLVSGRLPSSEGYLLSSRLAGSDLPLSLRRLSPGLTGCPWIIDACRMWLWNVLDYFSTAPSSI